MMIQKRDNQLPGVGDGTALTLGFLLAFFGLAMIFSAGELEVPSSVSGIWRKQAIWLAIALIAFVLTLRVSIRWIEWVA
ncbi:MAG TPA: hypothetical protein VLC48_02590, partial [Gemmatimonadota bacterium]|nr:hypothetical protein [Gemmatimonadota bacterium]